MQSYRRRDCQWYYCKLETAEILNKIQMERQTGRQRQKDRGLRQKVIWKVRRKGVKKGRQTWAELGTRQFCCDNVTMLSGHKAVCNCHFTIFIVATPSKHWGLTIFRFFSGPWGYINLSPCRCRENKKKCRVPSSAGHKYETNTHNPSLPIKLRSFTCKTKQE